jgi:hypothetical protein
MLASADDWLIDAESMIDAGATQPTHYNRVDKTGAARCKAGGVAALRQQAAWRHRRASAIGWRQQ